MSLVQMPEVGSALIKSATVGVPAGLICGAGGALLLGRLNWRGNVVVPAAIAAVAVVPVFGPALWALAAALLCGGLREHWRAEDIKKGQDKARRARQATGLVALIRNTRERRRLAQGSYGQANAYPIGTDETGAVSCLPLGLTEGRHSLVIGATGSGKTTTLMTASAAHIEAGCGLVVIDPKGDAGLADRLRDLAARAERDFEHFALTGDSYHWNPLGRGTPSERSDKLIAAEDWTEPHYKRLYQRYLLTLFTAVDARGETPRIGMVVDLLRPERLTVYARDINDTAIAERIDRHLVDLTDREIRDLAGLRNRIALLSESEFGHLLAPSDDGRQEIDLLRSITAGSVVVFSLSTSRYPETSKLLGAALFQDLKNVAGILEERGDKRPAAVVVDEFSAFGDDSVAGLFQRARSAGLSLFLATQELADLRRVDEGFQGQILGNVETVIAHRQNVPDSAELVAQLAGTRNVWIRTFQTDKQLPALSGSRSTRGTKQRGHEFYVTPDAIKQLDVGQAVVVKKNPHSVSTVQIRPASPPRPMTSRG